MIFLRAKRMGLVETPRPRHAHDDDAGLDLSAALMDPATLMARGGRLKIPVGWAFEIPAGLVGLVLPRSGLADQHGVAAVTGVIDSTYRGQVHVTLVNHGDRSYTVQPGARIAQMVIVGYTPASIQLVDELTETERGENGHGSTGA